MALTYTGTNGLFTHLEKLVKHCNQFETDATHASTRLDADRLDILDTFQAADQDLRIDGHVAGEKRLRRRALRPVDHRTSCHCRPKAA